MSGPHEDGAALHEAYHLGEALALLDKHADRYHWYMAKGRTRPTEPLYAVGLAKVLPNGVTEDDFAVIEEGNDIVSCVHKCLAKI